MKIVPILLSCLWIALIAGGSAQMWRYETTPGAVGTASTDWPETSRLHRTPGLPTLIMSAHPRCPCTKASMAELAALMEESQGRLTAHVLFFQPKNADTSWQETALWRAAREIPRVSVSADEEGEEAHRFGAETSGDVTLYDANGRLVFHGGITAARGHLGSNAGHIAISSLLAGHQAADSRTPVYGCPIDSPEPTPSSKP